MGYGWSLAWCVGSLLLFGGCATGGRTGWQRVCAQAPHQRMTPAIVHGLREAHVVVGLHGWDPTVKWVNEQCAVLGPDPQVVY